MSEMQTCSKCGAELPADAPAGLCPNCLVRAGLESEGTSEAEIEATAPSPASSGFEPPSVEELAKRFPQLEILQLLGKGGMGAVYKARQPGLDRLVAVKILPPEVRRDPSFAERFTREARAMARLSHPNIVAVHDFGQAEGLYYFVMEYVDGANLRQTIQAGKLQPEEALAIVPQICAALQFAHEEAIVHRDIKPENILMDRRGRVKIADFGLAKLVRNGPSETALTGTHQVMGTLQYMAPEQMRGSRNVDHRADIYSLGVVLYEMLTGELPIGRFAPPSKKAHVDARLDQVVLHALESEPDQRYQQISDVRSDVEQISASSPATSAQPEEVESGDVSVEKARTLSVPFSISKHGVKAGSGVMRLDDAGLTLEFVAEDRVVDFDFFDGLKPGLKHIVIPLHEIASMTTHRGRWSARNVLLRTHSLQSVSEVPASQHAHATLQVTGRDAVAARRLVEAVQEHLSDGAAVTADRMRVPTDDTSVEIDEVRRQVRGPAVGLLLAGIVNCLSMLLIVIIPALIGLVGRGFGMPGLAEILLLTIGFVLGMLMIAGAVRMFDVKSYWVVLAAAVAGLVPCTLGSLISVPFGIWALIILSRRKTKAAFGLGGDPNPDPVDPVKQQLTGPSIGLTIAGTINCLCLIGWAAMSYRGMNQMGRLFGGSEQYVASWLFVSAVVGIPILFAAFKMRQAEAYRLCVIGAIAAVLPLTPGALIGIPMGLWALAILTRQNIKNAFGMNSDQARDLPAKTFDEIAEDPPRCSRKAIFGAAWAPFFFIAAVGFSVSFSSTTIRQPTPSAVRDSRISESRDQPAEQLGSPNSPSQVTDVERVTPASGLTWRQLVLICTLLPLGLTAPFGTTVLGVVAISDIRHSQQRRIGLPLAVGDALLFPLLILDVLIFVFAVALVTVGLTTFQDVMGIENRHAGVSVILPMLFALPIALCVDILICRAVWRRANRPLHETTELKPPGSKTEADAVLRQLKGPAIGLVVTGIANWLTLPLLIAIALYLTSSSSTTGTPFGIMEGIVALAILVLSTLMILGGLKIMRCEGRGLGILGALLAMIVTPGNLIGLPLGIWALVVLNNREVKEAFQQNIPVWRATKFTTWAALLAVLAISAFVGVAAAVHLGSGHNPKGEIEYVVQPKEGHLTFAFDDITLVFEGIQTDQRSSRSRGWMPVRGGSKITIEMSGRSYSGKAESGPPGINMVTINGYTFQLAKNCTQLWAPFPKGSAPLYLDQIDGPVTIWIAEDGIHRLERRPSTTTTSNNGEAASTRK